MNISSTTYLQRCLSTTTLIDADHPSILTLRDKLSPGLLPTNHRELAIRFFYYVRDSISYRVTSEVAAKKFLIASETLKRGYGHCVAKATLLAALCRSAGIPTRFHFADLKNHQLTQSWVDLWGEKLLWHGYNEIWLDNKWIAANPSYDQRLCERHDYIPVEFDGINDALFPKTTKSGQLFVEYVHDHGVFSDIPFFRMGTTWMLYYYPRYILHRNQNETKLAL